MFEVNNYFEGKVTSLAYETAKGPSTLGVMADGEYEFGTTKHEVMTVVEGKLTIQRKGETTWESFGPKESFEVEANTSFKVKAEGNTSYLCQYS